MTLEFCKSEVEHGPCYANIKMWTRLHFLVSLGGSLLRCYFLF